MAERRKRRSAAASGASAALVDKYFNVRELTRVSVSGNNGGDNYWRKKNLEKVKYQNLPRLQAAIRGFVQR